MASKIEKLRAEVEALNKAEEKIRKERQGKEAELRNLYAQEYFS